MSHKTDKFISILCKFISESWSSWLAMTFIMAFPAALSIDLEDGSFHFAKMKFTVALLQSSGVALFLAILIFLWKNKAFKVCLYIVLCIFCLIEVFCFLHFKSRFNSNLLCFVLQTDANEISGFTSQYIFSWKTCIAILIITAIGIAGYYFSKIRLNKQFTLSESLIVCILVILFSAFAWVETMAPFLTKGRWLDHRSTPLQMIVSIQDITSTKDEMRELKFTMRNIEKFEVKEVSPIIILVIGESFGRHHSSLYGYGLHTNPYLEKERERGNLFVFTDAITRYAATGKVIKEIFSSQIESSDEKWSKFPLLPAIFKKSGYKVALVDNHATRANASDWDFGNTYFFNHIEIERQCFDYRNIEIYPYDIEISKDLHNIDKISTPKFLILHLMGQHSPAIKRIPKDFSVFNRRDYLSRHLDDYCADEVAAYDNACRYNDKVVESIITRYRNEETVLVYFSDHGEEIHDFRKQYGRTQEPLNDSIVKYVYEVPLFIWCSDKWMTRHHVQLSNIKQSLDKPLVVGDAAQLMMDLGGIHGRYFKPQFSVINPKYKPYKRIINRDYKYDK